jgi:hypothetical protein
MTVYLETVIQRLLGLSTDDKPLTDVREGSKFHAIDTGEKWIFHDGMWEIDISQVGLADSVKMGRI